MSITLTRHAEITAVLADPGFDVLTAPAAPHGLAWLRGAVSRFSRGAVHTRRRALAVAALAGLRPAHLRAAAHAFAEDAKTRLRDVPVTTLAMALGATRPVAEAVAVVTPGYFGGVPLGQSGVDDAVRELVEAFGGEATEATAARIGLLVQAHDATGGLVTNALSTLRERSPGGPLEAVLAESLRHDPPVPILRRECVVDHHRVPRGTLLIIDVAAANRDPAVFADPDRFDPRRPRLEDALTFGAGPRACPGRDHALALATGTVEGAASRG